MLQRLGQYLNSCRVLAKHLVHRDKDNTSLVLTRGFRALNVGQLAKLSPLCGITQSEHVLSSDILSGTFGLDGVAGDVLGLEAYGRKVTFFFGELAAV